MLNAQQAHIAQVMQVVGGAPQPRRRLTSGPSAPRGKDSIIHDSWARCVSEHRLDPTRMQEAVILSAVQLREHQDQIEAFLHIARHGLERLYRQVAGLGYCVLLTDARGVTVDFLGDLVFEPSLRKAGLYLGADWSEHHAGTCGVGTCIATGEALTVHLDDHFDATHIPLTCTAAPVFDDQGQLQAVLDISALSSPKSKDSQHLALQLVKMYAAQVENASFLQRYARHWVLRLSRSPEFLDVSPEYLLALDDAGCIAGHNRHAQLLLTRSLGDAVPTSPQVSSPWLGRPLSSVCHVVPSELGRFTASQPVDQRAVRLPGSKEVLFLSATPPARPAVVRRASVTPATVPPPLAALSLGDPGLTRITQRAARLVNSPINVLLTGETGTGKEAFARALHDSSERRHQAFVAVNCAAIPEQLVESELFGHLPGSFSGAGARGKRGLIQEADGGTLFLDEIGDMPLPLQARLLRVLAESEVLPVGATRPVAVNCRVVAATHCDLVEAVQAGRFRDDLYYRLNGVHFHLPALRERQDLSGLLDALCRRGPSPVTLDEAARQCLLAHHWPGNVRELCNVLDCARALCSDAVICLDDLPESLWRRPVGHLTTVWAVQPPPAAWRARPLTEEPLRRAEGRSAHQPLGGDARSSTPPQPLTASDEAQALREALRDSAWQVTAAARRLGVSRMTLYRRMKRHGLRTPNQADADAPRAQGD